jgi:predicted aspartyl protease
MISLCAGAAVCSAFAAECRLTKVAEWTVDASSGILVVEGAINGNQIGVALDTAANASRIAGSAADRLGLARREAGGLYSLSSGGGAVDASSIREFRVGGSAVKDWGKLIVEGAEGRDYAVVLGYDFFQQVDVEFDLAHNAVRLFQPQGCGNLSLAYWAPRGAGQAALERDTQRPAILIPVKLNGKPAVAALSTGASRSVVSDSFARLETFAMGDELIRDPALRTANIGLRDMLLGLDFLRAHRVLVANSQRRIYFTYTGGRVFGNTAQNVARRAPH